MVPKIKRFLMVYVMNRDLEETEREVLEVLADGKHRESTAYGRVADKTGSPDARKRSDEAEAKSLEFRRTLADVVGIDVLRGE